MAISTVLAFVFLLPCLIYAQTCTYDGKSYSNQVIFDNVNGCAKLQCQNGSIVPTYEACGKDIDGKCHYSGSQFQHNGTFYKCVKRTIRGLPVYVSEALPTTKPPRCVVNGKIFSNLEIFVLTDGCRIHQCQEGKDVILTEACDKRLDGRCHYVGSLTIKRDRVYNCQRKVINGALRNAYIQLNPKPDLSGSCTYNNVKYNSTDTYNSTDNCETFQCQGGKNVPLKEACRFSQNRVCYPLNTQWKYQDNVYECVKNPDGSLTSTIVKLQQQCVLGSKSYDHLSILTAACQISQCQTGQLVVISTGCERNGICQPLNTIWAEGSNVFQCAYQDPWGITVNRLMGGAIVPVCLRPAKDIIFVLDRSSSIGSDNFEKQKTFTVNLAKRFIIGSNAANSEFEIGTVTYATDVKNEFYLHTHLVQANLYSALSTVSYSGGWTNTHLAFDYIVNYSLFNYGRSGAGNVVIFVTDGASNVPASTVVAAKRLRDTNVQIVSVGVGNANLKELNDVSDNPANVFHVDSYDLIKQVEDLVSYKVCTAGSP